MIADWYWEHGVKRTDPKHAMSLDKWLDPVSRLEARRETVLASRDHKTCIAVWGMSQTGKSTLLSRYLDGEEDDGSDSALTWNPESMKVRFLAANDRQQNAAKVVFNPFNAGCDASGVAARYTLRSGDDKTTDCDFPIEMKFLSRKQFLHALARGYVGGCRPSRDVVVSDDVEKMLQQATGTGANNRHSFELMQDALDVVELMRVGTTRFSHLFQDRNWSSVRDLCLSSQTAVGETSDCETFVGQLLWDGDAKISALCAGAMALLAQLEKEWGGNRILMTAEVASLLLNIDSFQNAVVGPGGVVDMAVKNLKWHKDGNGNIRLQIGGQGCAFGADQLTGRRLNIEGRNFDINELHVKFGYLQALCKELVVPLRKEALESTKGRPLLSLLEKSDILDLPGLSRKSLDEAVRNAADLDDVELFKDVLKEGRTQSFVYNYAVDYSVDAFLLLVRSNEYVQKGGTINDGIKNWLRSFDQEWDFQKAPPLPVFIDITFFGEHLKNVAKMTPGGQPWLMVANWVQDKMRISNPEMARFFLTNYPNLDDGDLSDLSSASLDRMKKGILGDVAFLERLGLAKDDIERVFGDDGGVDRMLGIVAGSIDENKRRDMCNNVLGQIRSELVRRIDEHLPKPAQQLLQQRTTLINRRIARLQDDVKNIASGVPGKSYGDLAKELKWLFEVKPEWFDPIPAGFGTLSGPRQKQFMLRQVDNWYVQKTAEVQATISDTNERDEDMAIMDALRGVFDNSQGQNGIMELASTFIGNSGVFAGIQRQNDGWAARLTLAFAFSNILRTGTARIAPKPLPPGTTLASMIQDEQWGNANPNQSPHFLLHVQPLTSRIGTVAQNAVATARQPQPGDAQLAAIKDAI